MLVGIVVSTVYRCCYFLQIIIVIRKDIAHCHRQWHSFTVKVASQQMHKVVSIAVYIAFFFLGKPYAMFVCCQIVIAKFFGRKTVACNGWRFGFCFLLLVKVWA